MKIVRSSNLEFIPASHEDPARPGVLKKVLATRHDLLHGQVMMVNWSKLPVGNAFEPHYHEDMQEVFVILNGAVEMQVAGTSERLSGGDAILIDPREVHQMTNCCDEDVYYIVFGISTEEGGKTINV